VSPAFVVPENLLARFQSLSFERLERIDSGWTALTQGTATPTLERDVFRDVHTLKGDARVIGFREVALLSQRLEDLLVAAKARRFRVHDDVDIVVTMAIQFIGMLLRKRGDAPRMGIDLDGFVRQIDDVLTEWLRRASEAPKEGEVSAPHLRVAESVSKIATGARQRIASAATMVYLESLRAASPSRERLARIWDILSTEVAEFESVPIGPLLERHARAAEQLATDLGKNVRVIHDSGDVRARAEVLDTLNTATLHAVRNAVDHGIEAPNARNAANKSETGSVRISAHAVDETVEIRIEDDGKGVDLVGVRAVARSRGLLPEENVDTASPETLLDLLFSPGFTTRADVTAISGRGIGLDAARAALEAIGGRAQLTSETGRGSLVILTVPQPTLSIDVHAFVAPIAGIRLAVSREWTVAPAPGAQVVDLEALLELPPHGDESASHTLLFQRDDVSVAVGAAASCSPERATRICPTPRDTAVEVVRIGAENVLLLRLDVLKGAS
jgi:two-component system chemotaxis sensor kinase CheA